MEERVEKKGKKKRRRKKEKTYRLRFAQCLFRPFGSPPSVHTHPAQGQKLVVREHKRASVVCFQIVDLFSKHDLPQIFADEFDHVEGCGWARGRGGQFLD